MADLKARFDKQIRSLVPVEGLARRHQDDVVARGEVLTYKRRQHVFKQGDVDSYVFYLLEGELELDANGELLKTVRGATPDAKNSLAQLKPRQLSAKAKDKAVVFRIEQSLLDRYLTTDDLGAAGGEVEVSEVEADTDDGGDWMTRLLQSELFARIPPGNIQRLFAVMESVPARAGETIVEQDSVGEHYYVIQAGRCEVTRRARAGAQPIKLAELGAGDTFGEEALVSGAKRNATVTMLTDGELMKLTKNDFVELVKKPTLAGVDFDDARDLVAGGARWLDVRFSDEHEANAIDGSFNAPLNSLRSEMKKLDAGASYVVYCDNGVRSSAGAFLLAQNGFDVRYLEGGLASTPLAPAPAAESAESAAAARPEKRSPPAATPETKTPPAAKREAKSPPAPKPGARSPSTATPEAKSPPAAGSESKRARAAKPEAKGRPAARSETKTPPAATSDSNASPAARPETEGPPAARPARPEAKSPPAPPAPAAAEATEEAADGAMESVEADLRAASLSADVAKADTRMEEALSRKAEADAARRSAMKKVAADRAESEAQAEKAKAALEKAKRERLELERARREAEAEAQRRRTGEEQRLKQLREQADARLREEKAKLEAEYARQADELAKLRELKEKTDAEMAKEREAFERKASAAKDEVEKAERARAEVEELEKRLRAENEAKIKEERRRLEEAFARATEEVSRAQREREIAEAVRQRAAKEAARIVAEQKAKQAAAQQQEEARLRAEREKLEREALKLRRSLEAAKRAKLEAENAKREAQAMQEQIVKRDMIAASHRGADMRALDAEVDRTSAELEAVEVAHREAEAARTDLENTQSWKKEEMDALRQQIESELSSFIDENPTPKKDETRVKKHVAREDAHRRRREEEEKRKAASTKGLLDDVAAMLNRD